MKTMIETAGVTDGEELLSMIEGNESDGVFKMIATRRPNPVLSYQQENAGARIGIIRDQTHRIAAQFCITPGNYYINGRPCSVGYVGGVRKRPDIGGPLDWKAMASYVKDVGCELYTCSFLAENMAAAKLFTRERKHFPRLYPLTGYTTYMINPKAVRYKKAGAFSFRPMGGADWKRVLVFLNREGARYQFAPVVETLAQFYGLQEQDCYLLESGGEIKAFGALWNQSAYKQYIVTQYQGYMAGMKKFSRLFEALGYIPMPDLNQVLNYPVLSLFYAEAGDKDLYEAFLARICDVISRDYRMFLIGMAHNHPNRPSIHSIRSIRFDSCLYYVRYDQELIPVQGMPVFYECALL